MIEGEHEVVIDSIATLTQQRDKAYETIRILEIELAASEEGRIKLWSMIKIFTKSEQEVITNTS